MKLTDKIISLELAKRLHEAAKEADVVLPENEYSWARNRNDKNFHLTKWLNQKEFDNDKTEYLGVGISSAGDIEIEEAIEFYPALDTAELGEMLGKRMLETYRNAGKIILNSIDCPQFAEESEAEVRGEMYLYLLKNKLIK